MTKPIYRIYIEGSLHDETHSEHEAEDLRQKFEQEGWNVTVIKYIQTIAGEMGVKV